MITKKFHIVVKSNMIMDQEKRYWLYTHLMKATWLYKVSLWEKWSWNGPNQVESEWETYIG